MWRLRRALVALWLLGLPSVSSAQTATQAPTLPQPLTIAQAIEYASEHYPTLVAALEQIKASSAGVDVARSAYLPRLDTVWQSNRGTANNVFGQVLPQPVIPALSGPVLASASGDSIWSSATGALFTWEPLDFGLRQAGVTSADAAVTRAHASETLTRLDLQAGVASAFLTLLATERGAVVAQADLDRRSVLRQNIQVLVDNQLRPGADASRADAERAAAQTRLIQAQQAVTLARVTLGRLLGGVSVTTIDGAGILSGAPPSDAPPATVATTISHPVIQLRDAAVAQAQAAESVLARTFRPRVYFLASVAARGSGASAVGPFDNGPAGLKLDRVNWAAGFQMIFPNVFEVESLKAKRRVAAATTRAEIALDDESKLLVSSQQQAAAAILQSTRAVAANTPVQLTAARQSEAQARARYESGLATITEMADAQNVLAQAEGQDELARVDVWRALLATAVARGDLAPFLSVIRQP